MTDAESLTLEVLKQIRDEVRKTNERLMSVESSLGERIDATNERLGLLEPRQTAMEMRLATELTAVVGAIKDLKQTIIDGLEVRKKVDDHERRIMLLEQHTHS